MIKYQIGLDFGTHQSKVCVQDISNEVHEFFIFPSTNSFFLPSRVAEKADGTFEYGNSKTGQTIREYYYFKMAAAEDEEFWVETSTETNTVENRFYDPSVYSPYTPEFLATLYITFILLTVKSNIKINTGRKNRIFSRTNR
ncbi:MAG: hypothetical protein IPP73_20030 [Chitinophagaceae bacterium]|nr:hypothetical protein [Chitinophagaceae bacterium]